MLVVFFPRQGWMVGKCNFCTVLLYIGNLDQEFVIYALFFLLRHVGYCSKRRVRGDLILLPLLSLISGNTPTESSFSSVSKS
jgi:hypothetical protein